MWISFGVEKSSRTPIQEVKPSEVYQYFSEAFRFSKIKSFTRKELVHTGKISPFQQSEVKSAAVN